MSRMPRPTRPAVVAGALALAVLGISGCSGAEPAASPSPSASGFASAEAAYAEAEEVFRAYIDAGNLEREGRYGSDPRNYLTQDMRTIAEQEAETSREQGLTSIGRQEIVGWSGVSFEGPATLAQACMDLSNARIVDETGTDRTPPERPDTVAFEITFEATKPSSMLISKIELIGQC